MNILLEVESRINAINNRTTLDWLEKNISILRSFFEKTAIKIAEDEDLFMSSFYSNIYKSIYDLFNKLASTPKNAEIIYRIFEQMPEELIEELNNRSMIYENDIPILLNKWQNKNKVKHEDYLYFIEHRNYDYGSGKFDRIRAKCYTEESYINCRFQLGCIYINYKNKLLELKDSDDLALRMVFYRKNNFNWNHEQHLTIEKLKAYYDKDGCLFLDCLIENMTIYPRKEHQLLILRSIDKIPRINQFMENLHKFQNRKKELWELADDLCNKIEEEERQEVYAKSKEQEEYTRQQKLEDNLMEIHKLITGLKETIILSFILMSIGIAGLVWFIAS